MELTLTDESFRDGPQSLWANRLRTNDMLPAIRHANRAGYGRINLISAVGFEVAIKFLREDPFRRLQKLREISPETPSTVLIRGRNLFGWKRYSDDVVQLLLETLARLGVREFQVFDALNDTRNVEAHIHQGAKLGMRTSATLAFSESPVHTDEHFASKARQLVDYGASAILLYDATGVLLPSRARSLIKTVALAVPGTPIELSVHDQTGLALGCYREAIKLGVTSLATATRPLAGAESVPAIRDVIDLAHESGVDVALDEREIGFVDDYFTYIAYKYGKPLTNHVDYDDAGYRRYVGHQIPGGMMSHYRSQLDGLGLLDRLPELLEEAARVRVELGCPVMVTPFSQLVGVQAMLNVIDGKRYHTVPEDLRTYALGFYGKPPGTIDAEVADRLIGDSHPIEPAAVFGECMVDRARAESSPSATDEDVLLKLFASDADVRELRENEVRIASRRVTPLAVLVGELAKRPGISALDIGFDDIASPNPYGDLSNSP